MSRYLAIGSDEAGQLKPNAANGLIEIVPLSRLSREIKRGIETTRGSLKFSWLF